MPTDKTFEFFSHNILIGFLCKRFLKCCRAMQLLSVLTILVYALSFPLASLLMFFCFPTSH
ncbi:hypothetical protein CW304_02395 [Bacillus sp. UFRGS-B20]|nr:hypothetical protein CW304_02395 [Bacillus sp. UFRGS-B20]